MIACPRCGKDTHVSETRSAHNAVRRRPRRICVNVGCGTRVMEVLSPEAKGRLFERRMKWLGD